MTVDFAVLMNKPVEDAERPKAAPAGTYLAGIISHEFGTSTKKGTPYCRFNFQLLAAQDDVDEEALDEAGGVEFLNKKRMRYEFYLTDDAMFRLREFLEEALELSCSGRNFDEVVPETANMQVLVNIVHTLSDDGKDTYANIDTFAKAA